MTYDDLTLGPGMVGAITFVLRQKDGEQLDQREDPLVYLHGSGALVPGLEAALVGRKKDESFQADVEPGQGFGEYDEEAIYYVPRDQFPPEAPLEPGTMFAATRDNGEEVNFWVTEVEEDKVVVNENHPLAGIALTFEVTITGVRKATEQEVAEGRLIEE